MTDYRRYAIYYLPDGDLAAFGARWLGWDVDTGQDAPMPEVVAQWTQTPRKYGFHGTLKPPFALAEGTRFEALQTAARHLAATRPPVTLAGLTLTRLGSFFALTPDGDAVALGALAQACVSDLDAFRAPPSDAELARRRAKGLSPEQDDMLRRWGYPYVFDQFRFHLTLTGRVPKGERDRVEALMRSHLPPLPRPFAITAIGLVGERPDGRFETIERLPLTG